MIIFRVDANSMIGRGHMMRCISIATTIKMNGGKVLFVTREDSETEILDSRFMEYVTVPSEQLCSSEAINKLKKIIAENDSSVCVVDSYDVSNEAFDSLREICKVILVEDILYDVYDVDCIVNYNIYAEKMKYSEKYSSKTELLLGMDYAPIRQEFVNTINKRQKNGEINTILVTTGGSDPEELAPGIVDSLLDCVDDNVRLRVVTTKNSPTRDILYKMSNSCSQIVIEQDVQNMAKLMSMCDIAVSAAGSTCYELMSMGIPTCVFSFVHNQDMILETLVERDLMMYGGNFLKSPTKFYGDLVFGVKKLMKEEIREKLLENIAELNIGIGAENLAKAIMKYDK